MDGARDVHHVERELRSWRTAYGACNDKLIVLERLLLQTAGEAEMLEQLVDIERDVCARVRSKIIDLETSLADGSEPGG